MWGTGCSEGAPSFHRPVGFITGHCYLSPLCLPPTRIAGWPGFPCPFSSLLSPGWQRSSAVALATTLRGQLPTSSWWPEFLKSWNCPSSLALLVQQNSQKSPRSVVRDGQHCPVPSGLSPPGYIAPLFAGHLPQTLICCPSFIGTAFLSLDSPSLGGERKIIFRFSTGIRIIKTWLRIPTWRVV